MKILTVCDQGNNRSVVFAHLLKYWHHDVIPVGLATNSPETLEMLYKWADIILVTDGELILKIPEEYAAKRKLFHVGPDTFPRPMNPELLKLVKSYLEANKAWLKPTKEEDETISTPEL